MANSAAKSAKNNVKNDKALHAKLKKELSASRTEKDRRDYDDKAMERIATTHVVLTAERKKNKPNIWVSTSYRKGVTDEGDQKTTHAYTVLDIVNDDMPFLVDSITADLNRQSLLVESLLHPIVEHEDDQLLSHIHIRLHRALSETHIKTLQKRLELILEDVRQTTQNWKNMRSCVARLAQEIRSTSDESAEFLQYLCENHFTFLGISGPDTKGEGLLRPDRSEDFLGSYGEKLKQVIQKDLTKSKPVRIYKTPIDATVHRHVPADLVAIRTEKGIYIVIGLFTSSAYSGSVMEIPLLRKKAEKVVQNNPFSGGSHDDKTLRHILEKFPRDILFTIEQDRLEYVALDMLSLQVRQRIALYIEADKASSTISCLVYVPRDRYDTRLRMRFQLILEKELQGSCLNFHTTLDDSVYARVIYTIQREDKAKAHAPEEEIEIKLREEGRLWPELLSNALFSKYDDEKKVLSILNTYGHAFPVGYTERYKADWAVRDIEKLEGLGGQDIAVDLYRRLDDESDRLRLKIFSSECPVPLSDILPVLENFGLRVLSENPFKLHPKNGKVLWIHDFEAVVSETGRPLRVGDIKRVFEDAFMRVHNGEIENDPLNKLVIAIGMHWRDIVLLRTYVHYLRQIRFPFSRSYVGQTLTSYPKIAKNLVDLFYARLDPAKVKESEVLAAGCGVAIDHELSAVESLDQDRILRVLTAIVEASLRTNFFQKDDKGAFKPYVSIKFDSRQVPDLPLPRPYREIYVYSPRVEGIHLRGGEIARGGIRWSDRHEDFRTEILGLMKAQNVKNAIIVPVGAKGGFVVKDPPSEREAYRKEGIECYKTLVRGLLDITDNRSGEKIVPPKDVVRRDGDDPYLVVAADKGTATFSDTANALSAEYDFWLGDAFASGGSAGYDHKAMGITARGAWESVKRHFREMNHDIQTKPFDVIGVGDMGGDVFGNGMLLSEQIRLVGAFNHLHIFCDPSPEPVTSFAERKRLFESVKGWGDYDTSKLSKGGRIYNRSDKSLDLTPQIRERFNLDKDRVSPVELIRAMLKTRTDLLWFGGIGTYIKSSRESHADVGDKSNDPLRVNANELQASVIGEGANMAVTQSGRIEYAEKGGRINTDFIDNSGGVDCSDHEVNIKILLKNVMEKSSALTLKKRNALLESMSEEVARHVLTHNYQQTQALSLMELQAAENLSLHAEFIRDLEREQGLNRAVEGLPDEDVIEARARNKYGLTRAELCVIQAYAKITFTNDLMGSNIPESPELRPYLAAYFPDVLAKKYGDSIDTHRLRRNIVATDLANGVVNRMGATFVKSMMIKADARCTDVAQAYIIVREAFALGKLWEEIEALDNLVPAQIQLNALKEIAQLSERAVFWFLSRLGQAPDISRDTKIYGAGLKTLQDDIETILPAELKTEMQTRTARVAAQGLPDHLAHRIAMLPVLASACDIIRIARDCDKSATLPVAARLYFTVGTHFHFDWLRYEARHLQADTRLTGEALETIIDELYTIQAMITLHILTNFRPAKGGKVSDPAMTEKMFDGWRAENERAAARLAEWLTDLEQAGSPDLAAITVAAQRLRRLV